MSIETEINNILKGQLEAAQRELSLAEEQLRITGVERWEMLRERDRTRYELYLGRKLYAAAAALVGYKTDAEPLQNVWQREGERVAGLDELRRLVEEYRSSEGDATGS